MHNSLIVGGLQRLSNLSGDRQCFVQRDRALCDAVGRGLLRRGIRPGARIGILAENRLEFVACYFGIMRMGAVAVPVNHKLPRATIAHIFNDSAIELAFSDAARRPFVPDTVPTIEFDGRGADGFEAFLDSLKTPTPLPRPVEALDYDDTSEPLEVSVESCVSVLACSRQFVHGY